MIHEGIGASIKVYMLNKLFWTDIYSVSILLDPLLSLFIYQWSPHGWILCYRCLWMIVSSLWVDALPPRVGFSIGYRCVDVFIFLRFSLLLGVVAEGSPLLFLVDFAFLCILW